MWPIQHAKEQASIIYTTLYKALVQAGTFQAWRNCTVKKTVTHRSIWHNICTAEYNIAMWMTPSYKAETRRQIDRCSNSLCSNYRISAYATSCRISWLFVDGGAGRRIDSQKIHLASDHLTTEAAVFWILRLVLLVSASFSKCPVELRVTRQILHCNRGAARRIMRHLFGIRRSTKCRRRDFGPRRMPGVRRGRSGRRVQLIRSRGSIPSNSELWDRGCVVPLWVIRHSRRLWWLDVWVVVRLKSRQQCIGWCPRWKTAKWRAGFNWRLSDELRLSFISLIVQWFSQSRLYSIASYSTNTSPRISRKLHKM